jgi:hypothetical protein
MAGVEVGKSVRISGQQASKQPAGLESEPVSQITTQGPFAFGQRSAQKDGRGPLSGQTDTHLSGFKGARLPSEQFVGMVFACGTKLGKSDTTAGA